MMSGSARHPQDWLPSRGHLRHVLEFYQCFLDGLTSRIDYDARKRDEVIERMAVRCRQYLLDHLPSREKVSFLDEDGELAVRMENADEDVYLALRWPRATHLAVTQFIISR
jgi:hypothetical protein